MALVKSVGNLTHSFQNKCGEITFSVENDDISLHCLFCKDVLKKRRDFLNHFKLHHAKYLVEDHESEPANRNKLSRVDYFPINDLNLEDIKEEGDPLSFQEKCDEDSMDRFDDDFNEMDADKKEFSDNIDVRLTPDNEALDIDETYSEKNSTKVHKRKEVVFELINQMEKHENIWDTSHYDYDNAAIRLTSYESITCALKRKFPEETFAKDYVKLKIRDLVRMFRNMEHGRPVRAGSIYYEYLHFLRGRSIEREKKYIKNDGGLYECPICSKEFRDSGNLTDHIRRHRKQYSCSCNICSKPFYKATELRKHLLLHTKEKPYVCEMCGKAFRLNTKLQRHIKQHLQQRDYKCTLCPKAYYRKENLLTHMKTHADTPSETCDVCAKTFFTKRNLKQHKKLHSDVKSYVCSVCDKAFAQAAGRSAHMRKHKTNS